MCDAIRTHWPKPELLGLNQRALFSVKLAEFNEFGMTANKRNMVNERVLVWLRKASMVLDECYLDPLIGLLPCGIGDVVTAVLGLVWLWVSACVVKSWALTLAVLANILRDVAIGMVPFLGNVLDCFYRSNTLNLRLINGFVDNDMAIVAEVHRKKWQLLGVVAMLLVLIGLLAWLIYFVAKCVFAV